MSAAAFLAALLPLCGQAFEGRVVADDQADAAFAGKPLVMHVRECGEDEVRIPFHVGGDRSRTWVLTRTNAGLRLKHDHRHEDGEPDVLTMYGGDTASEGSAARQDFPVDAESIALFLREGRAVSTTNTWTLEHEPGERFAYVLTRPGTDTAPPRHFRVEFDLRRPVPPPPPPWGAEGEGAAAAGR